jgi:hypothetical protein
MLCKCIEQNVTSTGLRPKGPLQSLKSCQKQAKLYYGKANHGRHTGLMVSVLVFYFEDTGFDPKIALLIRMTSNKKYVSKIIINPVKSHRPMSDNEQWATQHRHKESASLKTSKERIKQTPYSSEILKQSKQHRNFRKMGGLLRWRAVIAQSA